MTKKKLYVVRMLVEEMAYAENAEQAVKAISDEGLNFSYVDADLAGDKLAAGYDLDTIPFGDLECRSVKKSYQTTIVIDIQKTKGTVAA